MNFLDGTLELFSATLFRGHAIKLFCLAHEKVAAKKVKIELLFELTSLVQVDITVDQPISITY